MKDRFHPLSTIGFASYILLCSIDRFFLPIPLAVYALRSCGGMRGAVAGAPKSPMIE